MRLTVTVVATAVLAGLAAAQLSLGPHGMSTPPINLLQLFRIAREIVSHVYDSFDQGEAMEVSSVGNEINEINDEITDAMDKADAKCFPGEKCRTWLGGYTEQLTDNQGGTENGDSSTDDPDENGNGDSSTDDPDENEDEENSTDSPDYLDVLESKYVVIKWVMAYVGIIITCSILIVIISVPYLITGQTFRSFDSGFVPRVDQEDSLLLLTWLLGEASGDVSCLERVVCLNPERSARYLAIPNVISSYLYRLVPVRYQERLRHLEEVTDNGLHYSCQQYSCPVLPEL